MACAPALADHWQDVCAAFHDADAFLKAVGEYRAAIREVFDVFFAAR